MNGYCNVVLILGALVWCLPQGYSQAFNFPKKTWSLGYAVTGEQLPEAATYRPIFLTYRQSVHQFGKGVKTRWNVIVEPQLAWNPATENLPAGWEIGVNAGLRWDWMMGKKTGVLVSLSAGPHYFSQRTALQARGFLFSDNVEIGLFRRWNRGGWIVKGRFRHLSNANLKQPNLGIDNFFVLIGYVTHWTTRPNRRQLGID